jgi:hypothetical protein
MYASILRFQLHFTFFCTESDKGLKRPKHVACIKTQFCQTVLDCLFIKYCNQSGMSSNELTVTQLLLTNFHQFMKPEVSLPYPQQPATSLQSKLNTLHDLSSYLFNIHFNIILPSTTRSSNCSFSFRFDNQNLNFTHDPTIRNYIP